MTPQEYVDGCRALPRMATRIIAVDGFGGAGKSTLAATLGHPVVHTDDFASWEEPIDWWPRLVRQVLVPLGRNEQARFQRYDWESRELAELLVVEPGGVLIVEGVTSSRSEFRPWLAGSIWVDTPRDLRLARASIVTERQRPLSGGNGWPLRTSGPPASGHENTRASLWRVTDSVIVLTLS